METTSGQPNLLNSRKMFSGHEMCESFSWYYPRANFMACGSYYHETEQLFHQFGVNNVTWLEQIIKLSPDLKLQSYIIRLLIYKGSSVILIPL